MKVLNKGKMAENWKANFLKMKRGIRGKQRVGKGVKGLKGINSIKQK